MQIDFDTCAMHRPQDVVQALVNELFQHGLIDWRNVVQLDLGVFLDANLARIVVYLGFTHETAFLIKDKQASNLAVIRIRTRWLTH